MEVIEVNGGYGYQISHNNHITIFQPFIPSISGKKPFMEKRDAEQVGKKVGYSIFYSFFMQNLCKNMEFPQGIHIFVTKTI